MYKEIPDWEVSSRVSSRGLLADGSHESKSKCWNVLGPGSDLILSRIRTEIDAASVVLAKRLKCLLGRERCSVLVRLLSAAEVSIIRHDD
jgi:hypothetical protein